ncbi:MAG: hypothetical protein OES09_05265 [Gammaproteobacteria bacterium]|nr:hypothetical protein [Gammaproteobacteria bacterium]
MSIGTRDDIVRLFPGIQDHTIVEILATKCTVDQLEAASLLLADQDEGLIDAKREAADQLARVLDILAQAEIMPREDRDR